MNRRDFLKKGFQISAASIAALNGYVPNLFARTESFYETRDLAYVTNGSPAEMVRKAVELMGGIGTYVKKGDIVAIKPNIGWARRPEQAADTNPEVVAAIIELCKSAGARKVKVFDNTCNEAKRCYRLSGIEKAAKEAGAEVSFVYSQKFKTVKIPQGSAIKSWEFYSDALDADVFINVPIAKHHSLTGLTMGIKNIMGILGGNRGQIHNNFDQKIAELNSIIRPQLTILDCVNIMLRNGPQGGNLDDIKNINTIIAGVDRVAVDSLGATMFGKQGSDIGHIREAHKIGLGEIDLSKANIKKYNFKA
ncbi:DUF362 domain-containing protein [candidate division KSB1 bacterium]|nr:DUF362 domain-containing protein [candidate division KSB1 bacterium]